MLGGVDNFLPKKVENENIFWTTDLETNFDSTKQNKILKTKQKKTTFEQSYSLVLTPIGKTQLV